MMATTGRNMYSFDLESTSIKTIVVLLTTFPLLAERQLCDVYPTKARRSFVRGRINIAMFTTCPKYRAFNSLHVYRRT